MKAKFILLIAVVAMLAAACKDKEAEKKIAALEARLAEMEARQAGPRAAKIKADEPEVKPEGPLPVIEFDAMDHDFGTIKEGDVVEYTYKFKNTGDAPLIVQNAQPSCGCTVPDWTKEPIPVGGEGFVKAVFDSKGKPNLQNKTITVTANTYPKTSQLKFKAMVTPNPAATPAPLKK